MKHCNICNTTKKRSEFHARKASKDGLAARCKSCQSEYDRARANLPHRVARREAYAKTDKGMQAGNAAKKRWNEKHPKKRAAALSANNAVRDGRLYKPKACECCGDTPSRIYGHHDDYDKPLEVRWLCSKCHRAWHKENGPGLNA